MVLAGCGQHSNGSRLLAGRLIDYYRISSQLPRCWDSGAFTLVGQYGRAGQELYFHRLVDNVLPRICDLVSCVLDELLW